MDCSSNELDTSKQSNMYTESLVSVRIIALRCLIRQNAS